MNEVKANRTAFIHSGSTRTSGHHTKPVETKVRTNKKQVILHTTRISSVELLAMKLWRLKGGRTVQLRLITTPHTCESWSWGQLEASRAFRRTVKYYCSLFVLA